jgi:hypothetical protein
MPSLIAPPVAVSRSWARAPALACASPQVFASMTITGSGISAPTVSATDGAVKGTHRQGSHR